MSQSSTQVFIIDDNPMLTDMYKTALELHDIRVATTNVAADAIEQVMAINPSLILLDLRMPSVGGASVLKELKENPKTKGIPVVIFSSVDDESAIKKAKEMGADDYIIKSECNPSDVVKKVLPHVTT